GSSESHFKIQVWSRILSDMFIYNFKVICKDGLIIKDLVDQAFVQDLAEALRIDGKSKDSIHLSNTPQAKRVRYGSYSNDDHDGRYYSANNGDYDNGDSEGGNDNNDNEDSDDEGCNDSKMVIL
ncbi:4811_t:CDS:1, partial [Gigaspora rosea]